MDITLDFSTLAEEVRRSLSIIGKRSVDEKGNLLFKDVTLSSLEEPLIDDYFRQAVIDLAAELSAFIVSGDGGMVAFSIDLPENHSEALEPFIRRSCEAYCVSYALYSWLTVTAPRISEKYRADCSRQVRAVIRLVHDKRAPEAGEAYNDVSGEIVRS